MATADENQIFDHWRLLMLHASTLFVLIPKAVLRRQTPRNAPLRRRSIHRSALGTALPGKFVGMAVHQ